MSDGFEINREDGFASDSSTSSLKDVLKHLPGAKKQNDSRKRRKRRSKRYSGEIARRMVRDRTTGILAKNYEERRAEMVDRGIITHRSNKPWTSARAAYLERNRVPIYYRTNEMVTHAGYITNIELDLDPDSSRAEKFREHISDADTWSEFHDEIAKTVYIVEDAVELDDPFTMTELRKVRDYEPIAEDFGYSPAYVYLREGDFPLAPDS